MYSHFTQAPILGLGLIGGGLMLLFWIAIIIAIVSLVRSARRSPWCGKNCMTSNNTSNALDILKERYAKGEIDKAEFDAKKKDLME